MTSSNGNIFRVTGHLCGEFPGPRWIPRTTANDAETMRLNKRFSEAGDSRRYRAHYDVIVLPSMSERISITCAISAFEKIDNANIVCIF